MSYSDVVKKNNSSLHVLKTLRMLLQGNYTMSELVERLNENEPESVFNNSVVSKYINTCRYCNFVIQKIQNRYYVTQVPFGLNLSSKDSEVLEKLQEICAKTFSKNINKKFSEFIDKLCQYSNKNITRIEMQTVDLTIEKFEKAMQEEKKVSLILKSNERIVCVPLGVVTHRKKVYLSVKSEKEKFVALDKIAGMECLEEKFVTTKGRTNEAVFVVKGGLAQRYNLREHETLVMNDATTATITNKGEDRDLLLSRLMRYDSLCEIKAPIDYREHMKKIIDETLANYGE